MPATLPDLWATRAALLLLVGGVAAAARGATKTVDDDYVTVRPFVDSAQLQVQVGPTPRLTNTVKATPDSAKPATVDYATNNKTVEGIGLSYDGLSIAYGKQEAQQPQVVATQGVTTGDNYDLALNLSKIGLRLEGFYQNLRGFYVNNPQAVDPTWRSGSPFPQLPSMQVTNAGLSATYIFSPKYFSLAALFDQTQLQPKSGGSFLATLATSTIRVTSPEPLVQAPQSSLYQSDGEVSRLEVFEASLQVGYGYTYVTPVGLFLGGSVLFGKNLHYVLRDDDREPQHPGEGGATDLMLGAGYDSIKFFAGIDAFEKAYSVDLDYAALNFARTNLELYIGLRF